MICSMPSMSLTETPSPIKGNPMSKLVFPEHGGILVPDAAKVVKTIRHKERDGVYVIKIISLPGAIAAWKDYQWHYLDPWKGVASTTGHYPSIEKAVASAVKSIKENLKRERQAKAEARKSPARKDRDRFERAVRFFEEHAGSSYTPGKETKAQGRRRGAEALARAEQYALDHDWKVEWEFDSDEYQLGRAETEMPNEVLCAVLKTPDGEVLGSLGGIGDPTREYARVVEAELALEAIPR